MQPPVLSPPKIKTQLQPSQKVWNSQKKTLVLDLDETLVHSSFTQINKPDITLNVDIESSKCSIYVLKRPHLEEFLEGVSKLYEIVIYTASLAKYANPLIDILDPNKHIKSRLFREHCTASATGFVKDLGYINRDLQDIIIVDVIY